MSKQIGISTAVITVLAAVGFVVSWSSGFIVAAVATADVPATTLLVWRFLLVAAVLVVVSAATGGTRSVAPRDLFRQATIGLFAQCGYCVFVYGAVAAGIATGTTALIDAVQPLIVATLVGPLLGLKVRGAQWLGLIVGAIGVALVVQSQLGGSGASPLAYLLPVLAMACLIVGTFLDRRSPRDVPVTLVLTIHVTVTAVVLVVVALVTGTLAPPASPSFWLQTVLAAAFPTLAAYGLYWWLLRRVGITVVNALLFLVAPTTAIAGALLLAEELTILSLAGFVLCGAGVAAVLANEKRPRIDRPTTDGARAESSAPVPS